MKEKEERKSGRVVIVDCAAETHVCGIVPIHTPSNFMVTVQEEIRDLNGKWYSQPYSNDHLK